MPAFQRAAGVSCLQNRAAQSRANRRTSAPSAQPAPRIQEVPCQCDPRHSYGYRGGTRRLMRALKSGSRLSSASRGPQGTAPFLPAAASEERRKAVSQDRAEPPKKRFPHPSHRPASALQPLQASPSSEAVTGRPEAQSPRPAPGRLPAPSALFSDQSPGNSTLSGDRHQFHGRWQGRLPQCAYRAPRNPDRCR